MKIISDKYCIVPDRSNDPLRRLGLRLLPLEVDAASSNGVLVAKDSRDELFLVDCFDPTR